MLFFRTSIRDKIIIEEKVIRSGREKDNGSISDELLGRLFFGSVFHDREGSRTVANSDVLCLGVWASVQMMIKLTICFVVSKGGSSLEHGRKSCLKNSRLSVANQYNTKS